MKYKGVEKMGDINHEQLLKDVKDLREDFGIELPELERVIKEHKEFVSKIKINNSSTELPIGRERPRDINYYNLSEDKE